MAAAALAGFVLQLAVPAWADFNDGVAAYQRGDYAAARNAWQPLAESGQSNAQFNLALLYANGLGVAQSPPEARRWFQAAAEQGNTQAQYNLALMLQAGDGVPRDIRAARQWYEKAARAGLAAAQNNLGLMYLNGDGMPPDQARAIRWLGRAAGRSAQAKRNLDQLAEGLSSARVDASRVNVRAGPSRQSRVVDQVGANDVGLRLDARAGWSRLWFVERDTIGWIADRLLAGGEPEAARAETAPSGAQTPALVADDDLRDRVAPTSDTPEQTAPPTRKRTRFTIASASADLRAEPARDAPMRERLKYGTAVVQLSRDGGWRRVRSLDSGQEGWVSAFVLAWDEAAEAQAGKARQRAGAGSGGG